MLRQYPLVFLFLYHFTDPCLYIPCISLSISEASTNGVLFTSLGEIMDTDGESFILLGSRNTFRKFTNTVPKLKHLLPETNNVRYNL